MLKAKRTRLAVVVALAALLAACDSAPKADKVAAPAAVDTSKPWATVTSTTPENGFLMGNPDAKIHVIEYASLTCPHCAEFHLAAKDALKRDYVAKGLVKYEFRSFILNPVDLAASIVARCFGPERFFALSGAFFENQQAWFEPFTKVTKEQQDSLQSVPPADQLKAYARLGGMDAFVRARGVTSAQFDACLTNPDLRKQLEDLQKRGTETDKITGTPSFLINGTMEDDVRTWPALEAKLKSLVG